jgi:hypothetical protein
MLGELEPNQPQAQHGEAEKIGVLFTKIPAQRGHPRKEKEKLIAAKLRIRMQTG